MIARSTEKVAHDLATPRELSAAERGPATSARREDAPSAEIEDDRCYGPDGKHHGPGRNGCCLRGLQGIGMACPDCPVSAIDWNLNQPGTTGFGGATW